MRRWMILVFAATALCCRGPEDRPAPAPVRAVDDARPAPGRGGRMQMDDALALCLCDPSAVGECFDDGEACYSLQSPAIPANEKARGFVARSSAFAIDSNRPRFMPVDPSELRFLGKLEDGRPVCPEGVGGRVGHLRRGLRRAPPDLLGQSRHVWDEATYETVAWCGPELGSEVLR